MNNKENNKLIAEFMDMQDSQEMGEYVTPNYNTSWEWLMPVVEKIEDFHNINGSELEFQLVSYEDEVKIIAKHLDKKWEIIVEISADGSGKKANTYEAVVEFIKYYNNKGE